MICFINQAMSVYVHWCHKSELRKRHKLAKQDNRVEALRKSVECVTHSQLLIMIATWKNTEYVVTEIAQGMEQHGSWIISHALVEYCQNKRFLFHEINETWKSSSVSFKMMFSANTVAAPRVASGSSSKGWIELSAILGDLVLHGSIKTVYL